jgi:hypothetical protein
MIPPIGAAGKPLGIVLATVCSPIKPRVSKTLYRGRLAARQFDSWDHTKRTALKRAVLGRSGKIAGVGGGR